MGVASSDHVDEGVIGGFCQLCHGRVNPLKRMKPGDWLIYYSPRTGMKGGDAVRSFTAIGQIQDGEPYPFDMGNGFIPLRRDILFSKAHRIPISPLISSLSFIKNKQSWGLTFRSGFFQIPKSDFDQIAIQMLKTSADSIPAVQDLQNKE